jgi:HSP20 family protein
MALIRFPRHFDFTNPFEELNRMKRDMDRLFGEIMGRSPLSIGSGVFPPLNITEDAESIIVQAELPGIKPDDIEISVVGSTLTLRGERKPEGVENVNYHRRERKTGKFHKAVTLPSDIKAEAVVAECKNGVLRLVLNKAEHAKPRKIAIKTD